MKKFTALLIVLISTISFAATKLSDLPLGSAAFTGTFDSFPYVNNTLTETQRLYLSDIPNIPALSTILGSKAPIASPTFTGTVTAPTFIGNLTGNASGSAASFTGSLLGDVTGNQGATVVSSVGGSSAANVHSAELSANAATNLNSASTLVKRDSSGNFSAGTITATLNGNATGSAGSFSGSLSGDVTGTQAATVVSTVGGKTASAIATTVNNNTTDVTLNAVGSVPNSSGASLSGQALTLQPADGSNPGLLTSGSQTIGGVKTFSSAPNLSSLTASQALVLDSGKNISSLSYSTSSSASSLLERDSNGNAFANNFIAGATNVVSGGTTTTLTAASTRLQQLTGSSNQTFKLPDATTVAIGSTWEFNNNSTGTLSVVDNGSNAIASVPSGGYARVVAIAVSTANGSWDKHFLIPSNGSYGTAGMTVTGTLAATSTLSASNFSGSSSGVNTGDQTITLTSDVTGSGTGSFATTISSHAVSNSKFRQSSAQSLVGNSTNATADVADISASAADQVMRATGAGTSIGFGSIDLSKSGAVGSTVLGTANGGTSLATLAAHDVLVGNGTSAVTLVAPSATSGVPLVSNGASADPSYGTAVVGGGGTGATSFTAYSVITAGTTSTGALQNVSGVGTSGQVLTSNGASALPTWQSIGAGSWPTSEIIVNTMLGHGSTNTKIVRFTNIAANNGGSDISYTTSSTNGDSFTINTTGIYTMTLQNNVGSASSKGISLNGTSLSAGVGSVTDGSIIAISSNESASDGQTCTTIRHLTAGDVIRIQDDGVAGVSDLRFFFQIRRLN